MCGGGMDITKMRPTSQKWVMGGFIGLALAAQGWAVDRYTLEIPSSVMAGDTATLIKVIPVTSGEVAPPPHLIKFLGLPSGIRIEPLSSSSLTVDGPTQFRLIVDPSFAERRVVVRVQKTDDTKVTGSGFFNVDRTVTRFSITPAGMTAPQLGVPFRFQVVAMDNDGAIVTSYKDPVDLKVDRGDVQDPVIEGDRFVKGVTFVDLTFNDPDTTPRSHRLEAKARNLYVGQSERAIGSVELTLLGPVSRP